MGYEGSTQLGRRKDERKGGGGKISLREGMFPQENYIVKRTLEISTVIPLDIDETLHFSR